MFNHASLFKGARLDKYQATFSVTSISGWGGYLKFVFDAQDSESYNYLKVYYSTTQAAPVGGKTVDGILN